MRQTILAVLLAAGSMGVAQAAEKIRYEELPGRLAASGMVAGGFRVKVVTKDGSAHAGRSLQLGPDYVRLFRSEAKAKDDISSEDIPSGDIARIEIRRGRHFFDLSFASAKAAVMTPEVVCGLDEKPTVRCLAIAAAVLSPVEAAFAAFALGSAPVTLALDGAQFLLPPKVYELIP